MGDTDDIGITLHYEVKRVDKEHRCLNGAFFALFLISVLNIIQMKLNTKVLFYIFAILSCSTVCF